MDRVLFLALGLLAGGAIALIAAGAMTYIEARFQPYDSQKDVEGSFSDAYQAVRDRMAQGGPTWTPKP